MEPFKTLLIHASRTIPEAGKEASGLTESLEKSGFKILSFEEVSDCNSVDLILLLGGDGFFLEAIHSLDYPDTPIFGINFGNVGFLMNSRSLLDRLPELLRDGNLRMEEYPVLKAKVRTGSGEEKTQLAFNDFVLERMSGQSIHFLATVDETTFNRYSGDGMIIATSGGSTAYNLAGGGPVIHPGIPAMVITPLYPHRAAPFHSLQFSLLLPLSCTFRIDGQDVSKRPIRLVADGHSIVEEVSQVEVQDSGKRIRLLRTPDHRFIATLASKFIGDLSGPN